MNDVIEKNYLFVVNGRLIKAFGVNVKSAINVAKRRYSRTNKVSLEQTEEIFNTSKIQFAEEQNFQYCLDLQEYK